MFLDLEGDPFWTPERELTFLFGLVARDDGDWRYEAFWGHDAAGERDALAALIDTLTARLAADPGMHVYHYSPAEPSALPRMAAVHGVREDEVDDLLRGEVFVNLYTVVRQGFVVGRPQLRVEDHRAPRGLHAVGGPRLGHRGGAGLRALAGGRRRGRARRDRRLQRGGLPGHARVARLARGAPPGRHGLVAALRGDASEAGGLGPAGRPEGAARGAGRRPGARIAPLAGGRAARVPPPRGTAPVVALVPPSGDRRRSADRGRRGDRRP